NTCGVKRGVLMSLFAPHQLHWLPKVEGKNAATSHEQVHLGRYWKSVMPFLLLLIFLWGTLSASLRQPISPGLFTTTISASGIVQSLVYNLTFQNPSGGINIIHEIDVTQGEAVRQGQVLARLDSTLLQQNVNAAQAAVDAAQNRVNISLARQERAIKF